ncbi:MAG: hypothetical protein K2G88_06985 [Oscillospiraceae bacterium]|nr:hypothetical protein [Oscillospiraceae bacterium]MDE6005115.1 hypothetical protein [Oscillospiraceae bacterium]MDE6657774.1 hypothetical protein [Oscillospiraceae bacterium]
MKVSKICPKCQSNDIIRFDGSAGAYGAGNNIMTGHTIFSAIKVNRYVCCKCGFVEEWIDEHELFALKKSKKAKII